ncbi:MAG: hypothetical protein ACK5T0_06490 [Vampirovibrionales bacterium]
MSMITPSRITGSRLTPPALQVKASNTHRSGRKLTAREDIIAKIIPILRKAIIKHQEDLQELNSNNHENWLLKLKTIYDKNWLQRKIQKQEKHLKGLIAEWNSYNGDDF